MSNIRKSIEHFNKASNNPRNVTITVLAGIALAAVASLLVQSASATTDGMNTGGEHAKTTSSNTTNNNNTRTPYFVFLGELTSS
jgi:hypothetical protein